MTSSGRWRKVYLIQGGRCKIKSRRSGTVRVDAAATVVGEMTSAILPPFGTLTCIIYLQRYA